MTHSTKYSNKFYNGDKIYNLNSNFKFIIGNRSAGKTFYFKKKGVDEFLKNNTKFIIMRRYTTEIDIIKDNFFSDIEQYYNFETIITVKGYDIYINEKHAGKFIALTAISKYKSINMSDYNLIIFDEFIPEDNKYINQNKNYSFEVDSCLNIFQTVARGVNKSYREEVKFILISNSISTSNPYFAYFGIDKLIWNGTKKFYKNKFFSFEIINIENDVNNSEFGKFIENKAYGKYAMNNNFYRDNNFNICKNIPKNSKSLCVINYNNNNYTVFINNKKLYVKKTNVENIIHYSIEKDGEYKLFAGSLFHKVLHNNIRENNVYFEDVSIKNILTNY